MDHAFANGYTYFPRWWHVFYLPYLFLYRFFAYLHRSAKGRLVWKQAHECANLAPDCKIGLSASIVNFGKKESVVVGSGTVIRGILRSGDFGPAHLKIGNYVYLGDNTLVSCTESVEIGDETLLAHGVEIYDNDSHPVAAADREVDWKIVTGRLSGPRNNIAARPVKIGRQVWIGANSMIFKGVTIGDKSIISAGSVVTKSIPANVLAAGNPAEVIKEL